MDWITKGDFQLKNTGNRYYVYRRMPNKSKRMINIPRNIRTKPNAKIWLRKHYKSPLKLKLFNLTKLTGNPMSQSLVNQLTKPSPPYAKSKTPFKHTNAYGSPNNTVVPFNCSIRKHLYHRETDNGKVGFQFMVANNWSNRLNLRAIQNSAVRKNMAKLDAGRQGAVFLASMKRRVPPGSEFVIKICPYDPTYKGKRQILDIEWDIHSKVAEADPRHVPKLMAPLVKCQKFVDPALIWTDNKNPSFDYTKQNIMFSEYVRNGTLLNYIQTLAKSRRARLTDDVMRSFIYQVLRSISRIRKVYPGFIHGDLHLTNVLVKYGYPYPIMMINDFGWSKINNELCNPMLKTGDFAESWGLGPNTSNKYDHHFFLNELRRAITSYRGIAKDGFVQSIRFLEKIIPEGYRQKDDRHTREFRLKYNDPAPGIASLDSILADPYFRGAVSPKNKSSPWKPTGAGKLPSPLKKLPSVVLEPKPTQPAPRVFTNAELKAISAGGFMRLTPGTRARATALRKASPPKKAVSLPKKKASPPKKAASPQKKKSPPVKLPKNLAKNARFNRLVVSLMSPVGNNSGAAEAYARWNRAKARATNILSNRVKSGKEPFSPVAARVPSPVQRPKLPTQGLKLPKRPKPMKHVARKGNAAPPPLREASPIKQPKPKKPIVKVANSGSAKNRKAIKSPSGRVKVLSNKGHYVYANGLSLDALRAIAANMKISTNGLRLKKNIALALFSAA